MKRSVFPLVCITVAGLAVNVMAAQLAAKDPASTSDPASRSLALSISRISSTVETGKRPPLAVERPDRSLGDSAFQMAGVAIKYYCSYVGFDAANRMHFITGPTSGSWVEACPAAERLCKSARLTGCRKYGQFRKN